MTKSVIKDSVMEVLMYIFEQSEESENFLTLPRADIESMLDKEGFTDDDIHRSLKWLDGLVALCEQAQPGEVVKVSRNRMISPEEQSQLSVSCQGYLLQLEQQGILDDLTRELVLDRAMALSDKKLSMVELHWVVQMVLFNLPKRAHEFVMIQQGDFTPCWH